MKNILIFWKSPYPIILEQYFDPLYTYSGLQDINIDQVKDLKEFDGIVILCELNKNDKGESINLQEFQGIEIAKKLRLNKCKLPIIFTSFLSHKQIYNNNPESDIINSIGHKFIRLPVDFRIFSDTITKMRNLTDMELRDVQISSCNPEGIVNTKIHQIADVRNKLYKIQKRETAKEELITNTYLDDDKEKENKIAKEELIKCLNEIHYVYKLSPNEILDKFNLEYEKITNDNIDRAITFVENTGKYLISFHSSKSQKDSNTKSVLKKPWKLLLLDDKLGQESEIVQSLNRQGVDVICTQSAEEALKALTEDNDLRGKITVILSDYRLYRVEDGMEIMQEIQGYTFLQMVNKCFRSRILSGIIYSGLPRQFLLDTFNEIRIKPEIYSKLDLKLNDPNAINFLTNKLIETGEKNYQAILALPLGSTQWESYLHEFYLLYRNQPDYEIREKELSEFCTDWVEKYKSGEKPKTPMIKGERFSPKKVKGKLDVNETLNKFQAYFKTRRLALWLKHYKKMDKVNDRIAEELMVKGKSINEGTRKQFINVGLGLQLEEFPFGATIEELCWFDYDLGIKVLDNYSKYRNNLLKCEEIFGDFISKNDSLKKRLNNIGFIYTSENKSKENRGYKANYESGVKSKKTDRILKFNRDNNQPYLFDKTDFSLCLEFLDSEIDSYNEILNKEYIEIINKTDELWKLI